MSHLVVMDNWYTSIPLFNILRAHGTRALGTIRSNRVGFPQDMVEESKHLSSGQSLFRQSGQLVAYSFFDRKPVHFLSTFHPPNDKSQIKRRNDDGTERSVTVPTAVKDYSRHRSGVDTLDQLTSYYSITRRSVRWWPRLCWWLVDVAIHNAHKLFQRVVEPSCTTLKFRTALMHELAEEKNSHSPQKQTKRQQTFSSTHPSHALVHSTRRRECRVCSHHRSHRKETNFMCAPCEVYVCATPCYDIHRGD